MLPDRFWAKVDRSGDCWEWTASKSQAGYGYFVLRGKTYKAHRLVVLDLLGKALGPTEFVCHRCDNPACVRPEHLYVGSVQDNVDDMIARDRHAHGARHGSRLHPGCAARGERVNTSKLAAQQVIEIRARLSRGETQRALGRAYGVSQSAISKIARGKHWRHLQ